MTEVLHSPQSSSPSSLTCAPSSSPAINNEVERVEEMEEVCSRVTIVDNGEIKESESERDQLSLLALLLTLFRKSFWIACKTDGEELSGGGMEIGWPTNVRHVAHVTFDRFNGFLGLPDEFEPEVPRRAPSASTTVFGVSTESMQLSFDTRGNSVPVILILLQRRLYAQGGLQAEGIFRINAENSQEEYVREQLNRGVVPQGIDVHCLAGLIKAWFRELPTGVLDSLSPDDVMQCRSEEDCADLVRLLPSTEAALLGWAINLMADVVEMEHLNKMNAHNIATVFAPNMTQMADPLTALMYAVQVMNFLKSLITKTLRERVESDAVGVPVSCTDPSDESGNRSPSQPSIIIQGLESASESNELGNTTDGEGGHSYSTTSMEESYEECESPKKKALNGQSSVVKDTVNVDVVQVQDKGKGITNLSLINSLTQRIEAWR
ncbi:rho GTPase-activating protein 5-like [Impatiens glandulifera]|uniref:rho GTPase-activating protein 5-like n=1 Tax=Impatiens glandulifera TaxID=253017 RepID=UPI001FB18AE8|nr:rho GTPase-activating protein 5-like [Impatiens glandulifera]